jgi:hypothetical protein
MSEKIDASFPLIFTKLRRVFYTSMLLAAGSPETQKRGVVVVIYFFDTKKGLRPQPSSRSFEAIWKFPRLMSGLPLQLSAVHLCYDSVAWSPKQAILKVALGVFTRIRLRSHYGKFFRELPVSLRFGNLTFVSRW